MLRILKLGLVVAVLTGGLLLVPQLRCALLRSLGAWLDVGETPTCTDFVLILPGEEIGRPLMSAALLRTGLARIVLIPQNPQSADVKDGMTLPTAIISRRVLEHRRIPPDRIVLLPSQSRTTIDDARALSGYLRGKKGSVAVVTSAFHTRRARLVFDEEFAAEPERFRIIAAPNPGFDDDNWWKIRDGCRLVVTEYVKLGYYEVRYHAEELVTTAGLLVVLFIGYRVVNRRRRELSAEAEVGNNRR